MHALVALASFHVFVETKFTTAHLLSHFTEKSVLRSQPHTSLASEPKTELCVKKDERREFSLNPHTVTTCRHCWRERM
jgi:hypothetical protein